MKYEMAGMIPRRHCEEIFMCIQARHGSQIRFHEDMRNGLAQKDNVFETQGYQQQSLDRSKIIM